MTNVPQESDKDPGRCVIYAAKSTEDKHLSIPTQIEDCKKLAERNGWEILGVFSDEGFSAFSGNRGPDLIKAKGMILAAATDAGGDCLFITQHSDRVARGAGDAPDASDHLVEVVSQLRRGRVTLRTVQDDLYGDPRVSLLMAAVMGQRNTEDSLRKGNAVSNGLRKAATGGKWTGGQTPDGYRVIRSFENDRRTATVEFDPERKPIFDLIWDLALKGYSEPAIARELNAEGYTTHPRATKKNPNPHPRPFERNRISQILLNPFYAGLKVHRKQVAGFGQWPGYVSPVDFVRLERDRILRVGDRKPPKRGRPAEFVLAEVAVCGGCGGPMYTRRGHHRRKDGTYPMRYDCRSHKERRKDDLGRCPMKPIDSMIVDEAVRENLPLIFADLKNLEKTFDRANDGDRKRLEAEVTASREEAAKFRKGAEQIAARVGALYANGEAETAAGLERSITYSQQQVVDAEKRVNAALDALSQMNHNQEAAAGEGKGFVIIQERIAASVKDVKRLNELMRDTVDRVALLRLEDGTIRIVPSLSGAAAARVMNLQGGYRGGPGPNPPPGSGPFMESVIDVGVNPHSGW